MDLRKNAFLMNEPTVRIVNTLRQRIELRFYICSYKFYLAQLLLQINTERSIKNEIKRKMDSPQEDIFEKAQQDVFRLMEKGPFLRYMEQADSDAAKPSSSQEV